MAKKATHWYKLDNAGKLYPSIASSRVSTVFRLTAVLTENVKPITLQRALEHTAKDYPLLNVRLRKGLFWFYFEHNPLPPILEKEQYYPCTSLSLKSAMPIPYKVLYHNNRIHLEISHAIADGYGALIFIKALIKEYHRLLSSKAKEDIMEIPLQALAEDAFQKYYEKNIPPPPKVERAFHFPFKLIEKGTYEVTCGIYSASAFKALAKANNTSPTRFLLCLFFETLLAYLKETKADPKAIVINVPVNLRGLFDAQSMRNFFVSVTPSIDPRLGNYSRRELLDYIDHYFGLTLNDKFLKRYISRNVRNERLWHIRMIPLAIKNKVMPLIYNYYGESSYTSSLSNLGPVGIQEPYGDLISRFEVVPPPSEGNIIKVTAITYRDVSTISFGSLTQDKTIEKIFFRKLRKENIMVKIESNQTGGPHGLLL